MATSLTSHINPTDLGSIERHWVHSKQEYIEVRVINICEWLDNVYGADSWYKHPDYSYEKSGKLMVAWLNEHGGHYYADERQSFFTWKACEEADEAGKPFVIVEDLS